MLNGELSPGEIVLGIVSVIFIATILGVMFSKPSTRPTPSKDDLDEWADRQ